MKTLFLLVLVFLTACSDGGSDRKTDRSRWSIGPVIDGRNVSAGMPKSFSDSFDFPRCDLAKGNDGPSVNYVVREVDDPIAGTMTLTYEIEASDDASFVSADGKTPARIALYFQRRGDDWGQAKYDAGYRQWSRDRVVLAPGEHSIAVPLATERWTPGGDFDKAVEDVRRAGFTFGGANAGHGVCLQAGTAKFTVKEFSIR